MSVSRILKWVTGALEAFLAIPFFGGWFIVFLIWTPLAVMLALHIITLVLTKKDNGASVGSVLGIITSCLAWIPIIGMILHILSAIFIMINAATPDNSPQNEIPA